MKQVGLKFLVLFVLFWILCGCQSKEMDSKKILNFGKAYTKAWNSMVPQQMASFYAEKGSLTINNGKAAIGRDQLAQTAASFMEAFPDMHLVMDSIVKHQKSYRYYWTFRGTNTGPGGSGNKVIFSGYEEWILNNNGLIEKSIGTFDAEDYQKQLEGN